jgi:hypothetical protein
MTSEIRMPSTGGWVVSVAGSWVVGGTWVGSSGDATSSGSVAVVVGWVSSGAAVQAVMASNSARRRERHRFIVELLAYLVLRHYDIFRPKMQLIRKGKTKKLFAVFSELTLKRGMSMLL